MTKKNKENQANVINFGSDMVQFRLENAGKLSESFASYLMNPFVTWAKFILTDDEPNNNGVRVPKEEFSNLIDSGIYMPIKMDDGIIEGHDNSKPIGVITHLRKVQNRIEGLAALWTKERPEDIDLLKEKYANNETLNLSWEIGYDEKVASSEYEDVFDLKNTILRATTLVSDPAYSGRTTIIALAEEDSTLEKELQRLNDKYEKLEASFSTLEETNKELENQVSEVTSEKEELTTEMVGLQEFKDKIEAEREREKKLSEVKEKFSKADIKKDEDYFEDNSGFLLSIDEDKLDFFISELVSVKEENEDENEELEENSETYPKLPGSGDTGRENLVRFLKERDK